MQASIQKDDYTEKLMLTIVKSLQPVTDDDIYLEHNEISEEEINKEIKDRFKRMQKPEKTGETFVVFDEKEIWRVKKE